MIWWLCCLPLELLRIALLPVDALLYVSTWLLTMNLWVVLWFVVHFNILAVPDDYAEWTGDRYFILGFILLYLCYQWRWLLRKLVWALLATWWRLPSLAPTLNKLCVSMAAKKMGSRWQNRKRMTERLSPELRKMLSGGV